jgi:anaerobic C4-dicarboxylate transporter
LPALQGKALLNARGSTLLFLTGIIMVVLIGIFPNLRPMYEVAVPGAMETHQVSMGMAIMIVRIAISDLTMILIKASPETTLKGTIMRVTLSITSENVESFRHSVWVLS